MPKERLRTPKLPKGWQLRIRSAVLNAISLANYSLAVALGQARNRQGSLTGSASGSRRK